ncbi:vesicle-associated membrane protein 1-like isoform X1 [Polypterus senegalus]|uniref:vesicle-associated membrane protein 1-like isoform X1 n=1 Tax=Polypterus senegalus TaxID=55291 RepID=UPI00196615AD|nr:vesicle-associated membrane protein 1-like isoform X1 [Polypterus senegalus]
MSAPVSEAFGAAEELDGQNKIPDGGHPEPHSSKKLQKTQGELNEVVDTMRFNVDKILKRDDVLSELDEKAEEVKTEAEIFQNSAKQLSRKYWWQNSKMMILMGAICAIIIGIVITPLGAY